VVNRSFRENYLSEFVVKAIRFFTQTGTRQFFDSHADELGKSILSIDKSAPQGVEEFIRIKRIWDACCAALVEVGATPSPPARELDEKIDHQLLTAHLRRYKHQCSKLVEHLFIKLPCSLVSFD
jgi:hypothetical protein